MGVVYVLLRFLNKDGDEPDALEGDKDEEENIGGVLLVVALIITPQDAVCKEVDGTLLERESLWLAIYG